MNSYTNATGKTYTYPDYGTTAAILPPGWSATKFPSGLGGYHEMVYPFYIRFVDGREIKINDYQQHHYLIRKLFYEPIAKEQSSL